MSAIRRYNGLLLALLFFAAHALLVPVFYSQPRAQVASEMQVALPRFAQLLMAAGDRYLAANLAGFRALVAATEKMNAENYRVLARVQSDVAWFNPAHEDNYYIAAPVLPWNGELEAAQYILSRATDARPFDWQPPFYYGFNELHFLKNPARGAEWIRLAAQHTDDELQQIRLQQLAALWVAKGEDVGFAIRLHRAMAKGTRHKSFAQFLEKRAVRLENLSQIGEAVERFHADVGRYPENLQEMVKKSYLRAVPDDPFGLKYLLDSSGKPHAVDNNEAQPRTGKK